MISLSKSILRRLGRRNFCSGGGASSKLIGQPSLMLPPSYSAAVELEENEGISPPLKLMQLMKYNFYSPLKKIKGDACYYKNNPPPLKKDMVKDRDILRFYSRGGKEEVALMQDKDTTWVGSSHGWLVLFNKNNRSMSLISPVSGRRIHLPPLGEEKKIKLRQYPVKVILSHSPDDENCRAIAIHGKYEFNRKAAVCSPGRSERWSPLGGRWNKPSRSRYTDFVYSASLEAFVSSTRVLTGWLGLGRPTDELQFWVVESRTEAPLKTTRAPLASLWDTWQTYLVTEEESGQLFMVRRYLSHDKNMVEYNVYRIESYFGGLDVQLCESLDDLVMFIGMNHSFAVKASRFPEYRPNCIYFSGGWNWKNGSQNKPLADIYDYKSKDYSPLFYSFSGHDFPFDHKLPWFTLTHDKDCTRLDK